MTTPNVTVKMNKAPTGTNFTVKILTTPQFKFRLWLGRQLMQMGARIIGGEISLIHGPKSD
jgi:hypothetical protein